MFASVGRAMAPIARVGTADATQTYYSKRNDRIDTNRKKENRNAEAEATQITRVQKGRYGDNRESGSRAYTVYK